MTVLVFGVMYCVFSCGREKEGKRRVEIGGGWVGLGKKCREKKDRFNQKSVTISVLFNYENFPHFSVNCYKTSVVGSA